MVVLDTQHCFQLLLNRSSRPEVFCKKDVFKNFTGKHQCQSLFFNKVAGKKEILTKMFSCEFCKISKNIFSYRTTPVAASGPRKIICCLRQWKRLRKEPVWQDVQKWRAYTWISHLTSNFCDLKIAQDLPHVTTKKTKFSIKDFFSKCDQIRRRLRG